jgi:hypothetical protein
MKMKMKIYRASLIVISDIEENGFKEIDTQWTTSKPKPDFTSNCTTIETGSATAFIESDLIELDTKEVFAAMLSERLEQKRAKLQKEQEHIDTLDYQLSRLNKCDED